jgi:hypothetical protein
VNRWLLLALAGAAFACGPRAPIPAGGSGGSGDSGGADIADAGTVALPSSADAAPTPSAGPVTEAECGVLFEHVVRMGAIPRRKADPEDDPTEEEIAEIRDALRTEFTQQCLALDRATYECALNAWDRDALTECAR